MHILIRIIPLLSAVLSGCNGAFGVVIVEPVAFGDVALDTTQGTGEVGATHTHAEHWSPIYRETSYLAAGEETVDTQYSDFRFDDGLASGSAHCMSESSDWYDYENFSSAQDLSLHCDLTDASRGRTAELTLEQADAGRATGLLATPGGHYRFRLAWSNWGAEAEIRDGRGTLLTLDHDEWVYAHAVSDAEALLVEAALTIALLATAQPDGLWASAPPVAPLTDSTLPPSLVL